MMTSTQSRFPSGIQRSMKRSLAIAGFATALAFSLTACKSNPPASAPITNAADPSAADGNMAPVSGQASGTTQVLGQTESYSPQQSAENYTQAPAPIQQGYAQDQNSQDNSYPSQAQNPNDQSNDQYNEQGASDYASEPPPPLPEYQQPPAPDPNYLWTPGYWNYGNGGYYWVPGVWCPPPYYGALWTPPYWGFYGGRYGFHHGYWGLHVGFYGGVNYGFGYIGTGYWGGYWHGNDFYYNRSVNNVRFNTNVYDRAVVYNNVHYGAQPTIRISYNGGRGGIAYHPGPAEFVAMHENHTAPIAVQEANRQAAMQNRGQFYAQNHGRPEQTSFVRPAGVPAGAPRIAEAPAAVRQEQQHSTEVQQRNNQMQQHNQQAQQQNQEMQQRNNLQQQKNDQQQQHNVQVQQQQHNEQAQQQRNEQQQQRNEQTQQAAQQRTQQAQQHAQQAQQHAQQAEQKSQQAATQQRTEQAQQATQQRAAQAQEHAQQAAQQSQQRQQQAQQAQQRAQQSQQRQQVQPQRAPAPAPHAEPEHKEDGHR
jgi:hypothetical protein